MSKELEALYKVNQHCEHYYNANLFNLAEFEVVIKALTPPTANEVCEALSSEFSDEDVYFKDNIFYWSNGGYKFPIVSLMYDTSSQKEKIHFDYDFPLKETEMVIKFYKGVKK